MIGIFTTLWQVVLLFKLPPHLPAPHIQPCPTAMRRVPLWDEAMHPQPADVGLAVDFLWPMDSEQNMYEPLHVPNSPLLLPTLGHEKGMSFSWFLGEDM